MTEQQAQSPIDDLFRKTLENLPDSPAESGWDTPSDRVWQHVQANIAMPRKGLGTQSLVLLAALGLTLAAGLFWMLSRQTEKPIQAPSIVPLEQPATAPSTPIETVTNQPVTAPKSSTGSNRVPPATPPAPKNTTEEKQGKPGLNSAQPLPGSKQTLPPNSTEAQKKKSSGN